MERRRPAARVRNTIHNVNYLRCARPQGHKDSECFECVLRPQTTSIPVECLQPAYYCHIISHYGKLIKEPYYNSLLDPARSGVGVLIQST